MCKITLYNEAKYVILMIDMYTQIRNDIPIRYDIIN